MSLKNWSVTAASNTSAPPNGAPEGTTLLKDFNDICRQMMADVRTLAASDTIASAATCDLGSKDATFLTVSGTTTITALGTVSAGIWKAVTFSGALTLTHNATSLILPGAANITTVAGDTALFLSLGSGNWKCMFYQPTTYPVNLSTAFSVYQASATAQSIPASTYTKVVFDNENIDGNSNFDSTTNYRFTPTVAGNYQLNVQARLSGTVDAGSSLNVYLYKNGIAHRYCTIQPDYTGTYYYFNHAPLSTVVSANGSTDYYEVYLYHNHSSALTVAGGTLGSTSFSGFRVV